jgi:hypothetical protein
MIKLPTWRRRARQTLCTINVECSASSVHAHVDLDDALALHPGDRVKVHGPAIQVGFGERMTLRREATVEQAGLLERAWVRFAAHFELAELYEVSFTPGRLL